MWDQLPFLLWIQRQAHIPFLLSNEKFLFYSDQLQKRSGTAVYLWSCFPVNVLKVGFIWQLCFFQQNWSLQTAFSHLSRIVSGEGGCSSINLLHGSVKALSVSCVTPLHQIGKTFIPSSSHFCTSVPVPDFLFCQLLPLFPLMNGCVTQWDLSCIFVLCCLTCSCFDSSEWANEADQKLSGKAQTSETCSAARQWYSDRWAAQQGHMSLEAEGLLGTLKGH